MFRGSITAMVTPMSAAGVDEARLRAFVDWQIAEGTHGLVPVGTTGESPTLSHDEHKRVVEITIEVAAGRVPVIAGAGSNNTLEAIDLARHAEHAGADAVLVVTPYYNKPNQEGLYQHFKAINDAIGIPIIIYNIPPRSVIDMSVETMARLFELPNIIGVKDATAKLDRVSLQRHAMGPEFLQLSGEDGTALAFNAHGGHGCSFRDLECRAEAVLGVPGSVPVRRLRQGARLPGPPDAAAQRAVHRAQPHRREVRALAARPCRGSRAPAAGVDLRDHPFRDPRRHGACGAGQLTGTPQ